ncbi:unnamed protein product, partial [Strongylus vulgaris]
MTFYAISSGFSFCPTTLELLSINRWHLIVEGMTRRRLGQKYDLEFDQEDNSLTYETIPGMGPGAKPPPSVCSLTSSRLENGLIRYTKEKEFFMFESEVYKTNLNSKEKYIMDSPQPSLFPGRRHFKPFTNIVLSYPTLSHGAVTTQLIFISTGTDSASSADAITKIYACATMWHETTHEMTCMLKSIFRMDEDQCARRNAQKYLK